MNMYNIWTCTWMYCTCTCPCSTLTWKHWHGHRYGHEHESNRFLASKLRLWSNLLLNRFGIKNLDIWIFIVSNFLGRANLSLYRFRVVKSGRKCDLLSPWPNCYLHLWPLPPLPDLTSVSPCDELPSSLCDPLHISPYLNVITTCDFHLPWPNCYLHL